MKPLTLEEVNTWPALGPMNLDPERVRALLKGEAKLRELLFLRHGCSGAALYSDDGELQCSACGIDFKRFSAHQIEARFVQLGIAALALAKSSVSTVG